MKKLLTFSACCLLVASLGAQNITVNTSYGYANGGGVEVDLNNDGYQDLIIGGLTREARVVYDADGNEIEIERETKVLLFDPATNAYKEIPTDLEIADRAQFVCADLNGDGIMDLIAAESDNSITSRYGGGVYQGNGDGMFTKVELTFDDDSYEFFPVTVDVADFNNDGLTDIVAIGYRDVQGVRTSCNAVLMNKGNYHFEVTNTDLLQDYELALAIVQVLDFDNDGYMDFFITANCDNPVMNSGARVISDVFRNLGEDDPGFFYRLGLGEGAIGVIKQKGNGGVDIADFNNDGYLDIVLHGEGGTGTGEPSGGDEWLCISHMYLNQNGRTVAEKTQSVFLGDLRPLNSTHNSTRAIDWTGNGHYDIFVPGWCTTMPDGAASTQAGFLFTNDGTANLGITRVPGASEVFVLFPDWNNDGIKDYFMIGQSWDDTYFTEAQEGRLSALMLNTNPAPAAPVAPKSVSASVYNDEVTIDWVPGDGAMANYSYEYFVRSTNGKFTTSCAAHIGGDLDGKRKLVKLGNAMLSKAVTLYGLPEGIYDYGVQSVNAAYDGSTFTKGTFVIGTGNSIDSYADASINISVDGNSYNVIYDGQATVEVYNAAGTLINAASFSNNHSNSLNPGLYIVKVTSEKSTVTEKIIIR